MKGVGTTHILYQSLEELIIVYSGTASFSNPEPPYDQSGGEEAEGGGTNYCLQYNFTII